MTTYVCDNCDYSTEDLEQLRPLREVPGLEYRLDAGSLVPHGECPECQCFCYELRDYWLNDAAPKLLDALQFAHERLMVLLDAEEATELDQECLLQIEAAIAQAQGEPHVA